MRPRVVVVALLAVLAVALFAQECQGEEGHPVITPYPGSRLNKDESEHKSFGMHEFPVYDASTEEVTRKTIKGEYWNLYYEVLDSDGNLDEAVSFTEILENYKQAALERGGTVLYEDAWNGYLSFSLLLDSGKTAWVYLEASDGSYWVWVVEEQGLVKKVVFGAEEMKAALDKDGRVVVYGIPFDTDKAALKMDSLKPLQEIIKLLQTDPTLRVEIQGHTDNQGAAVHNKELSQRRAEAVRNFLLLFGISDSRLTARGYGMERPIAPNDTEEGRAQNRRVELVKQ